jgi:hypothetical protein
LELSSAGTPVIAYYDLGNTALKLAVCNDPTCAASTIRVLDDGVSDDIGQFNSLALTAAGTPVVSYVDLTNLRLKIAICADRTCLSTSTATLASIVQDIADLPLVTSLVISSRGPMVAFMNADQALQPVLQLAVCQEATCSIGAVDVLVVDSSIGTGLFPSMQLSSSGNPVIAYYEFAPGFNLKLAICANPTCSANTIFRTLDSTGDVGRFASLQLTAVTNIPIVAYYDNTDDELQLAVCNNSVCASNSVTVVDSNLNVGQYASLQLSRATGFPVIAYFDFTNRDLKLAVCRSLTCSFNTSIEIVDADDAVGDYASLRLLQPQQQQQQQQPVGSEVPVIAYHDVTTNDLNLAVLYPS